MDIAIIDRGDGPKIAGTRITVYDVVHYLEAGRDPNEIAEILLLSMDQVLAAVKYIEHKAEVMAAHQRIEERLARGNPPEVEAMRQATRARMQAWLNERRRANPEDDGAGGRGGR